jgi:hypothetical protein
VTKVIRQVIHGVPELVPQRKKEKSSSKDKSKFPKKKDCSLNGIQNENIHFYSINQRVVTHPGVVLNIVAR